MKDLTCRRAVTKVIEDGRTGLRRNCRSLKPELKTNVFLFSSQRPLLTGMAWQRRRYSGYSGNYIKRGENKFTIITSLIPAHDDVTEGEIKS